MTDRNEKKAEALELYEQGISFGQIAKQLDVPKSTVHRWTNESHDTVLERSGRLGTFYGTETNVESDDDLGEIDENLFDTSKQNEKGLSGADLIALTETNGNQRLKLMEQKHRLAERSRQSTFERQMQLLAEQKKILEKKQYQDEQAEQRRIKAELEERKAEAQDEILSFLEEYIELHQEEDVELTDLQSLSRQAKRLKAKAIRVCVELGQKKETVCDTQIMTLLEEATIHLSKVIVDLQEDEESEIEEFEVPKRLLAKTKIFLEENTGLGDDEDDNQDEEDED